MPGTRLGRAHFKREAMIVVRRGGGDLPSEILLFDEVEPQFRVSEAASFSSLAYPLSIWEACKVSPQCMASIR